MHQDNELPPSPPEMVEPHHGGSYMRDPNTGELVLIDHTKPAVQVEKE